MDLEKKIKEKKARVAVIGLGYVGLPTAVHIAKAGFEVFGIDIKRERVKKVNSGNSYIGDVSSKELKEVVKFKKFKAFANHSPLKNSDVVLICVPTPLDKLKNPDLSYVKETTKEIAKYLKKEQLIILESTCPPETTKKVILPELEKTGLKVGKDFYLAHCPERLDPGNKKWNLKNIPRVAGGITKKCTRLTKIFYQSFIEAEVFEVSSPEAAEMAKLLENAFRLVNISFINELALLAGRMGIDIWEVIEAAKTKPFGFMPFYPSPKCGGHCFDGNQYVFVKNGENLEMMRISELYQKILPKVKLKAKVKSLDELSVIFATKFAQFSRETTSRYSLYPIPNLVNFFDTNFIFPNRLQVLSFDLNTQKPGFASIKMVSKRKEDSIINIEGSYNYKLKVTKEHPIIIYNNHRFLIKLAKDIKKGDRLVIARNLPSIQDHIKIDLIEMILRLKPSLVNKIRVKPIKKKIKKKTLKSIGLNWYERNLFSDCNYLPLNFYLKHEKQLSLKRDEIYLCTGYGLSFSQIKNIIVIDKSFARLVGYYLAEGCLTEEKTTKRIRLSFNLNERFYIDDVKKILDEKGIKYSCYRDKNYQTFHLKISSEILGILFKDVLKCGRNCYEMRIPFPIFFSTKNLRKEILTGILRGEGGVDYNDKSNSICISFYSSSPILFEQVQLILREIGIFPRLCKKREQLLEITGPKNIKKIKGMIGGEKEKKIEDYIKNLRKEIDYKKVKIYKNFITLKVSKITQEPIREVFSLEVEPTNTLITTSGIIAHNCIPIVPFFLASKAKEYNFWTRFIELAGQINEQMPHFVMTKVIWVLNLKKKSVRESKVLVWGVSYKKDIGDTRESAAYDIIADLIRKGAKVDYFDPFVPELKVSHRIIKNPVLLKSIKYSPQKIKKYDLVLILTDHSGFDYEKLAQNAKLVVDTKNAIKSRKHKNVFWL